MAADLPGQELVVNLFALLCFLYLSYGYGQCREGAACDLQTGHGNRVSSCAWSLGAWEPGLEQRSDAYFGGAQGPCIHAAHIFDSYDEDSKTHI